MAIVDKIYQRFDEITKIDRLNLINSFIFASANIDEYKPSLKKIDVKKLTNKEKIIFRLIPILELFKKTGRLTNFGEKYEDGLRNFKGEALTTEDMDSFKKKLDSLKTPGGEMGIWTNSDYDLSPLAKRVQNYEITTKRYISIVFLNLFSFFKVEDTDQYEYKHFLYEILKTINEKGVEKKFPKKILLESLNFSEKGPTKTNTQENILIDYLLSTEFFECDSSTKVKEIGLVPVWQKKINSLMNLCNLEYKDSSLEQVKEQLNRDGNETKINYSKYVSKNANEFELLASKNLTNTLQHNYVIKNEDNKYLGINRIYFGAPGTGKSFNIKEFIKRNGIIDYSDNLEHPNVFRTTLHPDYSYNDFVGQIMPVVSDNNITYEFTSGIFTRALKHSFSKGIYNKEPVFLILEEMSRANVAAVFGDLFQLLDRNDFGVSEYRIDNGLIAKEVFNDEYKKIFIPSNLFIIGTVNTSDQNVFVMDTAFKRRFEFNYVSTKITDEQVESNHYEFELNGMKYVWKEFVSALNTFIVEDENSNGLAMSEDKQLGYYFLKFKKSEKYDESIEEYNFSQITGKLIQYLWTDIEKVSYSNKKIFNESINSFGDLYEKLCSKENVFSKDLNDRILKNGKKNTGEVVGSEL